MTACGGDGAENSLPLTNRVWLTHVPKKVDDSVGALVVFEAKGRRQFGALYKGSMLRGSFELFEWQPDGQEGRAHMRLLQDDKSVKIRTESCEPDAGLDACIMLHGDPLGAVRYQSKRIWGLRGRPAISSPLELDIAGDVRALLAADPELAALVGEAP
ncbi:hypothetical protein SAMN02745121_00983 [Nannocystis exedens]|uniref:Uncharacterized protein n=1 Tax=Nannocystis exedens TaxID=54 RepID=A0A1I1U5G9_9BACT|nr:hypothetical protein [Nannocystis exedens]PCC71442.1 DNA gyrase subunit B [Nannocystis exedens]SFD65935.1 hypothetical protein SAMN02745121_00983 [Nannocystis exedens]